MQLTLGGSPQLANFEKIDVFTYDVSVPKFTVQRIKTVRGNTFVQCALLNICLLTAEKMAATYIARLDSAKCIYLEVLLVIKHWKRLCPLLSSLL